MKRHTALSASGAEIKTRVYYYWLLLALFFEYARPASFVPFLQIPFLYSVIPLLLFVVSSFVDGLRTLKEIFADRIAKWIAIFLGLIVLSALHADVTSYVYETFKDVLGYVLLFIMIARIVTTEARLWGVVMTLTLAHVFLLAMNPTVVTDPNNRHYILGASFLGDGNDFSLSLCLLFPFVIALALSTKKFWVRLVAWASVLLLLLAIIGTQSRGASLAVGAVMIYLWVHSSRKMLGVVAVGLVGVVVMIYAPPAYFNRMNTIGNYQQDGSAQGRIEAWKASLNMATDHPLMGVGAGHFPVAFGTKYRTPGAANMPWLTAHSSYMLVLGELGIPGLLCLLMLIIGNVRANTRLRHAVLTRAGPQPDEVSKGAATLLLMASAAAVGLGVAGAFLSAAYYPHFYVLTALLVSVRSLVSERTGVKVASAAPGSRFAAARDAKASQP